VQAAERPLRLLGGRLDRLIPVELPGVDETRYLVVIEKVGPTPGEYPRRPGVPAKNPLK
jgi:16S rRNA (guanine527-N7)-methyltransferase